MQMWLCSCAWSRCTACYLCGKAGWSGIAANNRYAVILGELHCYIGENLTIAVAIRVQADCIVTSDKRLAAHAPVLCLSLARAIEVL